MSAHIIRRMRDARRVEADGASVLHNLQVRAAGVAFFGEAGGGFSGLSGCSTAVGGT